MSQLKLATLVGSDKGGVGKSLLSQIVIAAYDTAYEDAERLRVDTERLSRPLAVIEIDNQRRLGVLYKDRVNLGLDASLDIAALLRDKTISETYFNKIYDQWMGGDSLTDLGANVTSPIFDWARHNDVANFAHGDGIRFRFVSVTTPDDQALRSAFLALREARIALGKDTELFLALNDTVGATGYRYYEATESWKRIQHIADQGGVRVLLIPYCNSTLLEIGRARGYTIKDLLQDGHAIMTEAAVQQKIDRLSVHVHVKRFLDWASQVEKEMAPLFVRPKMTSQAAA